MDFYKLSAKMRKARRQYTLTGGAQALYYELIAVCNEERWPDAFKCPNGELCSAINCSEKSLIQYRDELAAAELIQYQSGKSKRQPCEYSLNGCMNDYPIGLLNGGKIYSSSGSQSGSHSVKKTPDLLKHKSKKEDKDLNIDVVDDDNAQARKKIIEDAIVDYASNASFDPQHTNLPDEKEKNSAQKEKVLPTCEAMIANISDTAYWRNVVDHHKVTEIQRTDLFKLFYEQKEDHYMVRLPSRTDIVQHFYNWVPIHLLKPQLQQLNGTAKHKASTHTAGNTQTGRVSAKDKRAELLSLNQQAGEFLSRADQQEY